jgi:integrative and conjugative element protein (TIGR02256 family)
MQFGDSKKQILLELPADIVRYMRWRATMSLRKETGGILIGRYSADLALAVVVRATAPPSDSRAGATWFERGIVGVDKLLEQAWENGLHYLGEWHFHPGGLPHASASDRAEMRKIASDKETRCTTPVLVILGDPELDPKIAAYAQQNGVFLHLPSIAEEEKTEMHPSGRSLG